MFLNPKLLHFMQSAPEQPCPKILSPRVATVEQGGVACQLNRFPLNSQHHRAVWHHAARVSPVSWHGHSTHPKKRPNRGLSLGCSFHTSSSLVGYACWILTDMIHQETSDIPGVTIVIAGHRGPNSDGLHWLTPSEAETSKLLETKRHTNRERRGRYVSQWVMTVADRDGCGPVKIDHLHIYRSCIHIHIHIYIM